MSAIETERANLQRSLDDMRGKLDTARIGERLENDQSAMQMQVIETPEVPQYPIQSRRFYLLFVMALSGAAGLACALGVDLLNSRIRGTFDLADALKGQTLVVIPEWSPDAGTKSFLVRWGGSITRSALSKARLPGRTSAPQKTSQA
jgi:hypothetical protein